jgi:hypothetical protein
LSQQEETHSLPLNKFISYSIRIGESFYGRLSNHINLIKHFHNHAYSKQIWIIEAIKERLEKEEKSEDLSLNIDKYLNFKLDEKTQDRVEKRVKILSQFSKSFSRKKWILEAIEEKLNREEIKTRKLLEEINLS